MDALAALALQLEWGADEALADAPVSRFTAPSDATLPPQAVVPPPAPVARAPRPDPTAAPPAAPPVVTRAGQAAAAAQDLAELRAALAGFEGCPLRETAMNLVFNDGNPNAGLMLVGEGPGAEEDRAGVPFVGQSGRLLDRMLASIRLDRGQCLITNVIFWRPPGNRTPTDTEVLTCLPFLLRQIALVRPRRLVLLGGLAAKSVMGSPLGIGKLRGRWVPQPIAGLPDPVPTLATFHPAYLLRTPGAKAAAWADLLLLRRTLDADDAKLTRNLPPKSLADGGTSQD